MKQKTILFLLFFIILYGISYSQNNIDSLKTALKECRGDTDKIPILNNLAMGLYNTQPQLCFEYANMAYEISQRENYKIHYSQTLNALAVANWALGRYDKSLEYLFEKLKIHKQKDETQEIAATYRNIAIIYKETGRNELALEQLFKALEIIEQVGSEFDIAEVYNLLGVTYNQMDSTEKAKDYWLTSIKLYKKYDELIRVAYIKNNLAEYYRDNNKLDSAIIYYEESLKICREYNDNWAVTKILQGIAKAEIMKGNVFEADKLYSEALEIARKYELINEELNVLFLISELDTITKDYKSAYKNCTQYILLKDSINVQKKDNTISELQVKYETDKKEQENQLLKKSEKINSLIVLIIGISLFLSIILLIFLWRLIKSKQQANIELTKKNNEITAQNSLILAQKEELRIQSDKLFNHKEHLEDIVRERTQELLLSKEKAEESDRLKTAFLNNISHELRTPMNGIVGFSSLLTGENLSTESKEKYASIIKRSCNRLINIVSDTLDISEIQTKQTTVFFSNVNFESIINEIFNSLEFEISKKNLKIEKLSKSSTESKTIVTDESMLKKIIFHLVDNAVKFTHKGGIKVDYGITEKKFEFSIQDTGIGISKEQQKVIFTPFRQIETGATRYYGGNGLGLSIVKKYIEKLNGKMSLVSEIGKGTTINFYIPYN